MKPPLKILLTNLSLSSRSGTEVYLRDLTLSLKVRGHEPVIYSPITGQPAEELREAGIRVVAELADIGVPPDVIHGHHHIETMSALLHFPSTPGIFVCHDRNSWHDRAPLFRRIRRYVAVDRACRERLIGDGVAPELIQVVYNSVDLSRFEEGPALSTKPRNALLFSHYAAEHTHLPAVREACKKQKIKLDVAGEASGNSVAHPEALLRNYDIVFGKARCGLEAMATGRALVLVDPFATGPMVDSKNWDDLRTLNFGGTACTLPLEAKVIRKQIKRYDPTEAARVCAITRSRAGLNQMVDQLESLYETVVREFSAKEEDRDAATELRAVASYLKTRFDYSWITRAAHLEREVASWKKSAETAHEGWKKAGRKKG